MVMGSPGILVRLVTGFCAAALAFGISISGASAAAPGVRWDSDGMSEVEAPPFLFSLELTDYTSPAQIDREVDVRVDFSAEVTIDVCSATVKAMPLRDGLPVGEPAYIDAEESWDYVAVWVPVIDATASYALQIEASYETSTSYLCSPDSTTSTPYAATIDLFQITAPLPGPPSTTPVTITSSGPNTLVANPYRKSRPIQITFTVKDPERRTDLLESICMKDLSDCWIEDEKVKNKSWSKRNSAGWVRQWGFWWERAGILDCYSYAAARPNVSVIYAVSNSDGKILGKKKHPVRLTCSR